VLRGNKRTNNSSNLPLISPLNVLPSLKIIEPKWRLDSNLQSELLPNNTTNRTFGGINTLEIKKAKGAA